MGSTYCPLGLYKWVLFSSVGCHLRLFIFNPIRGFKLIFIAKTIFCCVPQRNLSLKNLLSMFCVLHRIFTEPKKSCPICVLFYDVARWLHKTIYFFTVVYQLITSYEQFAFGIKISTKKCCCSGESVGQIRH